MALPPSAIAESIVIVPDDLKLMGLGCIPALSAALPCFFVTIRGGKSGARVAAAHWISGLFLAFAGALLFWLYTARSYWAL